MEIPCEFGIELSGFIIHGVSLVDECVRVPKNRDDVLNNGTGFYAGIKEWIVFIEINYLKMPSLFPCGFQGSQEWVGGLGEKKVMRLLKNFYEQVRWKNKTFPIHLVLSLLLKN